ncbi:MAG: purine-nucleoside phosphorylase [Planctomycetes bacterium]|nr:purine-nucleoside phosphorylase [Planctomycetota bacterium]
MGLSRAPSALKARIEGAVRAIRRKARTAPEVGIILGTGLGDLASSIKAEAVIPYGRIPGFGVSTVEGHKGELLVGKLDGRPVVAMEGRFHFYEGYTLDQITLPVRVMRALGAKVLVVSNACGGMNPQFKAGDLMLIEDHINLMGVNPLIGPNDESIGPRFPDMSAPYDRALLDRAEACALAERIRAHRGVFVAVTGPCLETRAEYRFLRGIGADVVGMSTVPEVIVGVHCGLRLVGVSIVTDMCLPDALEPASLQKILAVANVAAPKLTRLVRRLLKELP